MKKIMPPSVLVGFPTARSVRGSKTPQGGPRSKVKFREKVDVARGRVTMGMVRREWCYPV